MRAAFKPFYSRIIHENQLLTGLITYFHIFISHRGRGAAAVRPKSHRPLCLHNGAHFMRPPPPTPRGYTTSY